MIQNFLIEFTTFTIAFIFSFFLCIFLLTRFSRRSKSFYILHARGMLELNETEAFAVHQVAYSSEEEARDEIGEFYRKITEPSERTTDCFHPQSLEFCIMEIKTK